MKKLLLLITIVAFVACNSSKDSGTTDGSNGPTAVDKDLELVTNVTKNIVTPKVQSFVGDVPVLANRIKMACQTEGQKVSDLRALWKQTMLDYHYLETLAFGPLSDNKGELSFHIYSWPDKTGGAVVDAQIRRLNNSPDKYVFDPNKMAGKGLDAFEHILYVRLNEGDVLDSNSEECPYFAIIAEDLEQRALDYKTAWDAELAYIDSPDGQTSLRAYMAEITHALFFGEKMVKDRKLSYPLGVPSGGVSPNCIVGENCQMLLEHQASLLAKEAIIENIRGLTDVLSGYSQKSKSTGFGYKDYIKELGGSTEIIEKSAKSGNQLNAWQKLPSGQEFYELVKNYSSNDCAADSLCTSFNEFQEFTRWMKQDFITILNTGLPGNVQGDND